jgi:hypothetical protein
VHLSYAEAECNCLNLSNKAPIIKKNHGVPKHQPCLVKRLNINPRKMLEKKLYG